MHIEARGLISDVTQRPDNDRISYFTALCPLQSGTILAGFQVGLFKHAPDNTVGLCRSTDGGVTWTAIPVRFETRLGGTPGSLAGAEMVEVAPGHLLLFATWFDRSDREHPQRADADRRQREARAGLGRLVRFHPSRRCAR